MTIPFLPSRADGRSDRQVVYELVKDAEPERLFYFEEIAEALQSGVDTPIDKPRIYRAVKQGGRTLQQRERRALQVVKGRGYRVLRANEHMSVARQRESSARRQMKAGLEILKNVREDELTSAERSLYRGHAHITAGLIVAIEAIHRRQDRQDQLIMELLRRTGGGDLAEAV
jgi:hypothetical protein